MSSITTFRGRRCTKVRRNSTVPASSSIDTSLTSIATSSLSGSARTESSTLSEINPSTLAPTTLTTSMAASQPSGPDETSTTAANNSVDPAGSTPSTTLNTVTLQTSSTTTSSTLVSPALASPQAPAPVASPDTPAISPQTPPPNPKSPSPDPSSGDDAGTDPATSVQPPKPNPQATSPAVSVTPSIAASVDPQPSQQPVSTDSPDPAASDSILPAATSFTEASSRTVTSNNASPLAASAASFSSSLISIPGSNPSGSIANPNTPEHTNGPPVGANSDSNGPAPMRKAAVAGMAVGGVLGSVFLLAIIFLLFRKFRRGRLRFGRQPFESPLLDRNGGPRSSSELVGKFGRFAAMLNVKNFMTRGSPSVYEGPSSNPIFSNMMSRSDSPPAISPRRRSWSAPAPAFREMLQSAIPVIRKPAQSAVTDESSSTTSQDLPQLPSLFGRTNGSVASISHAIYSPEPDSDNNPFRDPDPREPLRIVNPDPPRYGTPSSTPARPNKTLFSTELQSKPPLAQKSFNDSTNEVDPSNPLHSTNPISPSKTTGPSPHRRSASLSPTTSKQSSMGPLPQMAALQPQQQNHVSQSTTTSGDSGFVSAGASPISPREHSEPSARNYQSTTLLPLPSAAFPSTTRSSWTSDMNSFGEPGPTRPNTSIFGGASRISDPFDLDRPEVLGFTPPTIEKQNIVSRNNSNRSVNRKSASISDWPITVTIRPVQE